MEMKAAKSNRLVIDYQSSKVQKFKFDTHPKVKQMSDHYGVSTVVELI